MIVADSIRNTCAHHDTLFRWHSMLTEGILCHRQRPILYPIRRSTERPPAESDQPDVPGRRRWFSGRTQRGKLPADSPNHRIHRYPRPAKAGGDGRAPENGAVEGDALFFESLRGWGGDHRFMTRTMPKNKPDHPV